MIIITDILAIYQIGYFGLAMGMIINNMLLENTLMDGASNVEAKVRYEANKVVLLNAGWFVTCAVTGKQIYWEDLRYWNVERQEAYVDAAASWKRELECRGL